MRETFSASVVKVEGKVGMDEPNRGRGRLSKASKTANETLQRQKTQEKEVSAGMMDVENDSNHVPRPAAGTAAAAVGAAAPPPAAAERSSGPMAGGEGSSAAGSEAGPSTRPDGPGVSPADERYKRNLRPVLSTAVVAVQSPIMFIDTRGGFAQLSSSVCVPSACCDLCLWAS